MLLLDGFWFAWFGFGSYCFEVWHSTVIRACGYTFSLAVWTCSLWWFFVGLLSCLFIDFVLVVFVGCYCLV